MSDQLVAAASYPLEFLEEYTDTIDGGKTKTRLLRLQMKPLSDKDISEMDLWVRVRYIRTAREAAEGLTPDRYEQELRIAQMTAIQLSAFSGMGGKMIATVDGMARVIWQGIKDNHPEITEHRIRALMFSQRNLKEANAAFKMVNFSPAVTSEKGEKKGAHSTSGQSKKKTQSAPTSKGVIYRKLANRYGWSFQIISNMTPFQQLAAFSGGNSNAGEIVFRTEADYARWLASRTE
jgi:hypothetical protein